MTATQNAARIQGDGTRNELANAFAPLPPAPPPGRRENRESSFPTKQPKRSRCCFVSTGTLRCFEAMIEKDTRRQKGRPPRSDGAAGQKKEALFSTRRYRPNARRAALSKTDRAQSVYWLPALRAAWRIARFSPARNRTLINSPR